MDLHRDYLDILARRFRAEVMLEMANAFIDSHLKDGLTLQDMAAKLDISVDDVRRMFDLNDPSTKRALGMLSDMCAVLGGRPSITIHKLDKTPSSEEPSST